MTASHVALIVIDMQVDSFTGPDAHPIEQPTIERINAVAAAVRSAGGPVVFIQHDGVPNGDYEPGSEGWALLPGLDRKRDDAVVHKTTNDSFYETDLSDLLEKHEIRRLIVCGDASDFCVDSTVRAAVSRDYEITVVEDAHTAGNRPHLEASAVIAHHNFVWKGLILRRGQVSVLPAAHVIEGLKAG